MFTGIVTDLGEIRSVEARANNLSRLTIYTRDPRAMLIRVLEVPLPASTPPELPTRNGPRAGL